MVGSEGAGSGSSANRSGSSATMGGSMYRLQLFAADAREEARACPQQGEEDVGQRRVGDGDGAPEQQDEHDQTGALPQAWSPELDVQSDVGGEADQHADDVEGDVDE